MSYHDLSECSLTDDERRAEATRIVIMITDIPGKTQESILGLLIRAYGQVCAQAHGEEFLHHNIPAKCDWEMASQSIHSAINSVVNAECRVRAFEAKKAASS